MAAPYPQVQAEEAGLGDDAALEAARVGRVAEDEGLDGHARGQGDDGEVDAAHPQGGDADEEAERSRGHSCDQRRQGERDTGALGQAGQGEAGHAGEGHLGQRELSHEAGEHDEGEADDGARHARHQGHPPSSVHQRDQDDRRGHKDKGGPGGVAGSRRGR